MSGKFDLAKLLGLAKRPSKNAKATEELAKKFITARGQSASTFAVDEALPAILARIDKIVGEMTARQGGLRLLRIQLDQIAALPKPAGKRAPPRTANNRKAEAAKAQVAAQQQPTIADGRSRDPGARADAAKAIDAAFSMVNDPTKLLHLKLFFSGTSAGVGSGLPDHVLRAASEQVAKVQAAIDRHILEQGLNRIVGAGDRTFLDDVAETLLKDLEAGIANRLAAGTLTQSDKAALYRHIKDQENRVWSRFRGDVTAAFGGDAQLVSDAGGIGLIIEPLPGTGGRRQYFLIDILGNVQQVGMDLDHSILGRESIIRNFTEALIAGRGKADPTLLTPMFDTQNLRPMTALENQGMVQTYRNQVDQWLAPGPDGKLVRIISPEEYRLAEQHLRAAEDYARMERQLERAIREAEAKLSGMPDDQALKAIEQHLKQIRALVGFL